MLRRIVLLGGTAVVLAAASWWNVRDDAGPIDPGGAAATPLPVPVGEGATVATSAAAETRAAAEASSPFATTDGGGRAAKVPIAPTPADAPSVAVPDSYPIGDAARYHVPADERGPGNLGGPPPLDFPGGPNDPGRGDADDVRPVETVR